MGSDGEPLYVDIESSKCLVILAWVLFNKTLENSPTVGFLNPTVSF